MNLNLTVRKALHVALGLIILAVGVSILVFGGLAAPSADQPLGVVIGTIVTGIGYRIVQIALNY
jgi:hypothetical protein